VRDLAFRVTGNRIPFAVLLLIVAFLASTAWYTHRTLVRRADIERTYRDLEYQRTRLGLQQVNEETSVRGYVITGDRRFLQLYVYSLDVWARATRALDGDLTRVHEKADLRNAMESLHDRWLRTYAEPLVADPRRRDVVALQFEGNAILDRFRTSEIAFRLRIDRDAARADAMLLQSIDAMLAFGALANVTVLLTGLVLMRNEARNAERLRAINALYQDEKALATSLTEAFLPERLPDVAGIAMRAIYVPASTTARVGGDWYDAFELPDGRILFSIGDVAGHGVPSAVVMSRARQAILTTALHEDDPATVLARANATIAFQENVMVTAICGFIDPATGRISYATAGHPAPLLAHAEREPSFLPRGDVPLGIFADSAFHTNLATAEPGDLLVLYTDGVIEYGRDIIAGETRLIEAALRARAAGDPARAIFDAVFGGTPPADDVAIMTIAFLPRA
jgi:hypothetical protein